MLIFLLLRRSKRYLSKIKRPSTNTRRKLDESRKASPLLDAPPEILRWQVEMHETARELKAELDSKMSALQATIRMAREESERLEATVARAEQLGISPCADTLAAIEELNGGERSIGCTLPAVPMDGSTQISAHRDAIYQLADQGLAASEIANSIGVPLGDVELLISLRSESTS